MKQISIKIKKIHDDAVIPKNANKSDAGYDLIAINDGEFVFDPIDGFARYIIYKTRIIYSTSGRISY